MGITDIKWEPAVKVFASTAPELEIEGWSDHDLSELEAFWDEAVPEAAGLMQAKPYDGG